MNQNETLLLGGIAVLGGGYIIYRYVKGGKESGGIISAISPPVEDFAQKSAIKEEAKGATIGGLEDLIFGSRPEPKIEYERAETENWLAKRQQKAAERESTIGGLEDLIFGTQSDLYFLKEQQKFEQEMLRLQLEEQLAAMKREQQADIRASSVGGLEDLIFGTDADIENRNDIREHNQWLDRHKVREDFVKWFASGTKRTLLGERDVVDVIGAWWRHRKKEEPPSKSSLPPQKAGSKEAVLGSNKSYWSRDHLKSVINKAPTLAAGLGAGLMSPVSVPIIAGAIIKKKYSERPRDKHENEDIRQGRENLKKANKTYHKYKHKRNTDNRKRTESTERNKRNYEARIRKQYEDYIKKLRSRTGREVSTAKRYTKKGYTTARKTYTKAKSYAGRSYSTAKRYAGRGIRYLKKVF